MMYVRVAANISRTHEAILLTRAREYPRRDWLDILGGTPVKQVRHVAGTVAISGTLLFRGNFALKIQRFGQQCHNAPR